VLLLSAFAGAGACSLSEVGLGPTVDSGPDVIGVDAGDSGGNDVVVVDVVEEEAAGPTPASPGQIDAGVPLLVWVRADNVNVDDAGSAVLGWPDQSPAKNDLSQPSSTAQPTWNAQNAAYSNNPTIHFTQFQSLMNSTIMVAQPTTMFIVAHAETNISYFYDSADSANRLALLSRTGTTGFGVSMYSSGGSYAPAFGTGNVQPPSIIVSLFNGPSSAIFVSSDVTVGPLAIVQAAKSNGITLGNYFGGTYGLQGDLAEFAIFGGSLSLPDIQRLNAYASQRYGIKLN
jgi:hypothetical protein